MTTNSYKVTAQLAAEPQPHKEDLTISSTLAAPQGVAVASYTCAMLSPDLLLISWFNFQLIFWQWEWW